MIVRIVRMKFKVEEIEAFLAIFKLQKEFIASFEGCSHLELLRDINDEQTFFTYSYWENEAALERYRKSTFFREIWSEVKLKFEDKPMTWSLQKMYS